MSRERSRERSRKLTGSNYVNLIYLHSTPFGSFRSFRILSALYSLLLRFYAFFCLLAGPTLYLGTHGSKVGPNPWVGSPWVPTKPKDPLRSLGVWVVQEYTAPTPRLRFPCGRASIFPYNFWVLTTLWHALISICTTTGDLAIRRKGLTQSFKAEQMLYILHMRNYRQKVDLGSVLKMVYFYRDILKCPTIRAFFQWTIPIFFPYYRLELRSINQFILNCKTIIAKPSASTIT